MIQKLKVCFVDLKFMGMVMIFYGIFLISASILRMGPSYISLCKISGSRGEAIFYPMAVI